VLSHAGYATVLRDLLPASIALADGQSHEVDVHPVTPTPDGGGDQALEGGGSFHYPPPVQGRIDGRPVGCVDAQTQVRCHLGYPTSEKDRQDMRRLHERLGVELPAAEVPTQTLGSGQTSHGSLARARNTGSGRP
jgi:lincosamide nucleotidyltransferase A/C/D/E